MLKLKKLQMLGFKSFCDRTDVHFTGDGVVAVVGPNGCGKSNLADAISWVLGEQSAKSLRGGQMQDVIFAGTRERPATGMAEVSLTLTDPEQYEAGESQGPELVEDPTTTGWGEEQEAGSGEANAVSYEESESGEEHEAIAGEGDAAGENGSGVVLTIRSRRKFKPHNRKGEVVVTRRLYRTGVSEYLMNGKLCRLRDIQDLFMGTGLGPDCYAIIEQGRVGQILSSKPYDRRALIEEAAGVSKYKARRRQAEARLEASRQNLNRINDIYEEVVKQVASLKRQASKAQRFRALKAEFTGRQRRLVWLKADALQSALAQAQHRQAALRSESQSAQEDLQQRESERHEWLQHCSRLEQELRRLAEEAVRLTLELDRGAHQIEFNRSQTQELGQRVSANLEECGRVEAESAQVAQQLEEAQRECAASEETLAAARAQCESLRSTHQAAQNELHELEGQVEAARRLHLELLGQHAAGGNQIAQNETLLVGIDRALDRLGREEKLATEELEHGGARRGQLALQFQDDEEVGRRLAGALAELEERAARLRDGEMVARHEMEAHRAHLAELGARRRSLEDVVAHHGYSSEAVKHLFSVHGHSTGAYGNGTKSNGNGHHGNGNGHVAPNGPAESNGHAAALEAVATATSEFHPLGVLGEYVEVEPRYEHVVEEFLRDELNFVVVRNWDQAGTGVGLLRTERQGRATFLVHVDHGENPPTQEDRDQASRLETEPGITPLLREVKALNGFKNGLGEILPKLRDAYLLPDSAHARGLAVQYPRAYFLTPQGECFHHCTVTGGAGASTGPLSLKRELRELVREETGLGSALAESEELHRNLTAALENATRELERLRAERHEIEKRLLTGGQAVKQADAELDRVQAQLRVCRIEAERARDERAAAVEHLEGARQRLQEIETRQAEAQQREQQAAALINDARRHRDLTSQQLGEAHAALARQDERVRGLQENVTRLLQHGQDLSLRLEQMRSEREILERRRLDLVESCLALEAQLEQARAASAAAAAGKSAQEAQLEQARARDGEFEAGLAAGREQLEALRQAQTEIEVGLARLEADQAHLRETCLNDVGVDLEVLRAEPIFEIAAPPAAEKSPETAAETVECVEQAGEAAAATAAVDPAVELAALESSVRELRTRIENLGPVNMMALEEYEEARQRHDFMETQRKDLIDAIADTQQAIQEIDTVSRQKFQEAFEKINAYFQETFQVLFGGGQGFLRLSEAEEGASPLDAGIDIVAQPPGKKLQNALLLSGGEKAMTAMALLLAVFRYQPSPFCLLDEVDAPMDEANVIRFSEMVKRMSAGTQFIIITHNKRTMEVAPTLYGVTMPQAGISKLVSVNLERSERAAVVA